MRTTTHTVAALGIGVFVSIALAVAPALAHHSFAMYDMSVEKTLTGRLVRFVLGGNHSQYVFEVLNDDGSPLQENGKPVIWSVETAAASALARRGITVESFTSGTIFTITFSPLRDGRNGGAQRGPGMIVCGTTMPAGGCNEKTGRTM